MSNPFEGVSGANAVEYRGARSDELSLELRIGNGAIWSAATWPLDVERADLATCVVDPHGGPKAISPLRSDCLLLGR